MVIWGDPSIRHSRVTHSNQAPSHQWTFFIYLFSQTKDILLVRNFCGVREKLFTFSQKYKSLLRYLFSYSYKKINAGCWLDISSRLSWLRFAVVDERTGQKWRYLPYWFFKSKDSTNSKNIQLTLFFLYETNLEEACPHHRRSCLKIKKLFRPHSFWRDSMHFWSILR